MRELNFFRDQKLHEAWRHVQWNFMEDIEKTLKKSARHLIIFRILHARPPPVLENQPDLG